MAQTFTPRPAGTSTVDGLTDASAVGKALVKATDAPAARSALGAVGTSDLQPAAEAAVAGNSTVVNAAAAAVAGVDLVKKTDPGVQQVSPEVGLLHAHVDSAGKRTWLEATDTDGGPTDWSTSLLVPKVAPAVATSVGIVKDTQPGAIHMHVDSVGNRTWLEANDLDGGLTDQSLAQLNKVLPGAPSLTRSGRRNWELALTQRDVRPLVWLWAGASTTAGVSGHEFDKFITQIEKMLQSSYNPGGIRGGFTNKVRGSFTGSGGTEIAHDDLKQLVGLVAGESRTYTPTKQPYDGLELMYMEGPGYGPLTVTIPGATGSPFTITPDTSGSARATGIWKSPAGAITRGYAPITAACVSGIAALSNFRLNDGDRNYGVRVYNGAYPGSSTTKFTDPTYCTTWWQRVNQLQPDVLPIQLATNDINDGNSVATYQTNLQAMVTRAQTEITTHKIWIPIIAQQSTQPEFPNYIQAMRDVAAANPAVCTFHSYYDSFPRSAAEYAANTDAIMQSDMTHPTNIGDIFIGQLLRSSLGIPSYVAWPLA